MRVISKVDKEHLHGTLIVATGVFVLSFDALLIRLAQTNSWNIAFWRGGFMVLSVALFLTARNEQLVSVFRRGGTVAVLASLLSGIGSLLFVLSIMHTRVANTVVILSAAPLFAAVLTRLVLAEAVRLRTWIAIVVAFLGVIIVFYGSLGGGGLLGDLFALTAAAVLAGNLTLLRRHRDVPRIPVVGASGVWLALFALPFAEPFTLTWESYAVLAIMGLVQMPTALVLTTVGTRYLPAPEVSLFLLLETVLGPIWVWLALSEKPPAATLAGGALIVATLAIHSWRALRSG